MLFECLRLQIFDYELESFQVASERDFDSLIITDPFNDWSEMSYSLVGPLFVKQNLFIALRSTLDNHSDFLEVERLLIHDLNCGVIVLICSFVMLLFILR